MRGFDHEAHPLDTDHHDKVDGVMAKHGFERLHANAPMPSWVHPNRDESFHLHNQYKGGELATGHRLFHNKEEEMKEDLEEGFELLATHPTNVGNKFKSTAKTHSEVRKKIDDLRKKFPEHQVTVTNKHTGQALTFRANHDYNSAMVEDFLNERLDGDHWVSSVDPSLQRRTQLFLHMPKSIRKMAQNYYYPELKKKPPTFKRSEQKMSQQVREGKRLGEIFESKKDENLNESEYSRLSPEARELVLHANDGQLYNSSKVPVMKNAQKHWVKGNYDAEKGRQLWQYHADRAAHSYHRQYGSPGTQWHQMFPTKARREAASYFEATHRQNMQSGTDLA